MFTRILALIKKVFNPLLNKEEKQQLLRKLSETNRLRGYIICIATFIIEPLIIIFHDIPGILTYTTEKRTIHFYYLLLHLCFLIICIIALCILIRYKKTNPIGLQTFFIPFITSLGLFIFAAINTLEVSQLGYSNTFMLYFMVISVVILVNFFTGFLTMTLPFLFHLLGLILFTKEGIPLLPVIVNSISLYFTAMAISFILYRMQRKELFQDILLAEKTKELTYLAKHDFLTGLYNRWQFEEKLFSNSTEERTDSTLVVIDIDRFKVVNDQYGHPAADVVLKYFGQLLLSSVRPQDLVARWGGEEFLIYLNKISVIEAKSRINELRRKVEKECFVVEKEKICITASFGLAPLYSTTKKEFYQAYSLADQALYEAKNNGRNCVSLKTK